MIEKKDIALEKAVLIGVVTRDQNEEQSREYLDELGVFNLYSWWRSFKTVYSKNGYAKS